MFKIHKFYIFIDFMVTFELKILIKLTAQHKSQILKILCKNTLKQKKKVVLINPPPQPIKNWSKCNSDQPD